MQVSKMESNLRAYDSASAIPQALRESAAYVNANKKLTYIPLVFIIARIWGTLRFLLGISNPYAAVLSSYIAPFQVQHLLFQCTRLFVNYWPD